jgi:hypothetical protein
MTDSTGGPLPSATPELQQLVALLEPQLRQLAEQVQVFRQQPPTPERTYALERRAAEALRAAGRVLLEQENTTGSSRRGARTARCGCGWPGRSLGAGPRAAT